jgi:hypothetical protein
MQQQETCRTCRAPLPEDREACPRCGRVRESVATAWLTAQPGQRETPAPRGEPDPPPPGTALPGTALPGTALPGTALPGTALPAGREDLAGSPPGPPPAAAAPPGEPPRPAPPPPVPPPAGGARPAGSPAGQAPNGAVAGWEDPDGSLTSRESQRWRRTGPSGLPRVRWDDDLDWNGDRLAAAAAAAAADPYATPAEEPYHQPAAVATAAEEEDADEPPGRPRRRRRVLLVLSGVVALAALGYLAVRATDVLLQCRADGLALTGSQVSRPLQAPASVRALRRNENSLLSGYVEQERRRLAAQGFDNVDGALYGPSETGGSAFVLLIVRAEDDRQRQRFLDQANDSFATLAGSTTTAATYRLDGVDYRCIRSRGRQYNDVCYWSDGDTAGYGFSDTFGIERLSAVTAAGRQETVRFSRSAEQARPSCLGRLRWQDLLPG